MYARLDEDTSERSESNFVVSTLKAVRIGALSELLLLFKIGADVVQFDFHIGVMGVERREPAQCNGGVRITTTLDQPTGRLTRKYI